MIFFEIGHRNPKNTYVFFQKKNFSRCDHIPSNPSDQFYRLSAFIELLYTTLHLEVTGSLIRLNFLAIHEQ